MMATAQIIVPFHGASDEAARAVPAAFTPAQLHALNDQIASLRQISIRMAQARNPSQPWTKPWLSAAPLPAPQQCQLSVPPSATSAATSAAPSQPAPAPHAASTSGGASGVKRKAPCSPVQEAPKAPLPKKPKPGPAKKKAAVKEETSEEEEDIGGSSEDSSSEEEPELGNDDASSGSDDEDADVDIDAAAGSQQTASRRSGRRRTSIVSLRDADSDEEMEEAPHQSTGAAPEQAEHAQGVQLPAWKPLEPELAPKKRKRQKKEEIVCSVCGDADEAEGNAILLCDGAGCRVAAHQACYGVPSIPEGDWLCDGCAAGLDPEGTHCLLCPWPGSALRPVTSLGAVRPPKGAERGPHYVHLTCALWVPEVTLARPEAMAGVVLDGLAPDRAHLTCSLCKQAGGGVIQCAFGRCSRPLHPLCGRHAGHLLALREADGTPLIFCGLHSGERFARTRALAVAGQSGEEGAAEGGEDGAEGDEEEEEEENEFELQRQRNIERNRQRLAELQQLNNMQEA